MPSRPTKHQLTHHHTKRRILVRFLLLVVILLGYFAYVTWHHGVGNGLATAAFTWSFFVLCTPIADAGFLLDFPLRLTTGLRMIYSEIMVSILAIALNIYGVFVNPAIYERSGLLRVFYHILTNPWPLWIIILLSALGTFMSIYFGDELLDVANHRDRAKHALHKNKHRLLIMLFVLAAAVVAYNFFFEQISQK